METVIGTEVNSTIPGGIPSEPMQEAIANPLLSPSAGGASENLPPPISDESVNIDPKEGEKVDKIVEQIVAPYQEQNFWEFRNGQQEFKGQEFFEEDTLIGGAEDSDGNKAIATDTLIMSTVISDARNEEVTEPFIKDLESDGYSLPPGFANASAKSLRPEIKPTVSSEIEQQQKVLESDAEIVIPPVSSEIEEQPKNLESDRPEIKPTVNSEIEEQPKNLESDAEIKPTVSSEIEQQPKNLESDRPEIKPTVNSEVEQQPKNLESDRPEIKPTVSSEIEEQPKNLESDRPEIKPTVSSEIEQQPKNLESDRFASAKSLRAEIKPTVDTTNSTEIKKQSNSTSPKESIFESGVFTVLSETGEVGFDYLYDGGGYKGELAIFSLEGIEQYEPGSLEFIREAARRAASNSELGYIAISDITEGARFIGNLGEIDRNSGDYQNVKTVKMRSGDKFGVMLVPNGTVAEVLKNPGINGSKRPLFSMTTANPNQAFHVGQIADVTGDGHTFVMEDWRVGNWTDGDYNDFIFQVRGAKAEVIHLDELIPEDKDWRESDLGKALVDYANLAVKVISGYIEPEKPHLSDPVQSAIEQSENLDNYDQKALEKITEWVIWIAPGQNPDSFATLFNAENLGPTGHIENTYIWKFTDELTAEQVKAKLQDLIGSDFAYPLVPIQLISPQHITDDPLSPDQWHIENTGQTGGTPGADINVSDAWKTATGEGVVIGIVDGYMKEIHPDLAAKFVKDLSHDFNNGIVKPSELDTTPPYELDEQKWKGYWYWRPKFGWTWQWRAQSDPEDLPGKMTAPTEHATAVAGLAAASSNNKEGVSGVAPDTSLASLGLTADKVTDQQIADALFYKDEEKGIFFNKDIDVYNNSWKPGAAKVATPQALMAIEQGIAEGRDGKGNIYVFAAGNDGWAGENVNYNPFANSRYTIAVGAIDHKDEQSWYSEGGASLLVSTYSSSSYEDEKTGEKTSVGITTTDVVGDKGYNLGGEENKNDYDHGNYTKRFGGTSAAAPIVSGVVALMLDANPDLTWRDVQHILVETSKKNNFGEIVSQEKSPEGNQDNVSDRPATTTENDRITTTGWWQNGAGKWVNDKYGFGAVDAAKATEAAKNWTPVSDEVSITSGWQKVNLEIPDYDTSSLLGEQVVNIIKKDQPQVTDAEWETLKNTDIPPNDRSVSSTINITDDVKVETVEVVFDAKHTYRGDLKIVLTSPDGTESVLAARHSDDGDNYQKWVFNSVRHWGESSKGDWNLRVSDEWGNEIGTWNSWKLNVHGTANPANVSIQATDSNATEDGNAGQFVVKREGGVISQPLTVNYAIAGNATNGSDYKELTGTVTIPAGATTATIPVVPIHDYEVEGNETVIVSLTDADGYDLDANSSATATITNSTTTSRYGPFVYVNPANGHQYILSQPDTWLGAQEQGKALGGNLVTINNAAENNWLVNTFGEERLWMGLTDSEIYGATEGNFTWVNGESVTYTNWLSGEPNNVTIIPEGEDFSHLINNGAWHDLVHDATLIGWQNSPGIIEIDPTKLAKPIVNVMVTDAEAGENGNAGQIIFTRVGDLSQDLTVNYSVAGNATNGTDYQTLNGTIAIPAGESQVTIPIIPLSDNNVEGNETVVVNVGPGNYEIGTHGIGQVAIADSTNPPASPVIYTNPETGHQYFLTAPDTALGAQEQAQALGGNLVTVNDASETNWLSNTFGTDAKWIGFTDSPIYGATEGNYKWVSGEPVNYNYWHRDEASNTLLTPEGEDFVVFTGAGWNDLPQAQNWIQQGIVEIPSQPTAPILNFTQTYTENITLELTDIVVTDPDGQATVTLKLNNPVAGSLTTGSSGALTSTYNPATGEWTASGAVADVNALLASLQFKPAKDFNKNVAISVTITDDIAAPLTGTINLNGTPVNYAPTVEIEPTRIQTRQLGSTGYDIANDVAVDSAGNVYFTGWVRGDLDGNTYQGGSGLPGASGDGFLMRYNASGDRQWTSTLGSAADDAFNGVAVDSAGNAYVVGSTSGALDGHANLGLVDGFFAKYDANGNIVWSRQIGTTDNDELRHVVTDGAGNIYTVGYTNGLLDGSSSGNGSDALLIKWDSNGNILWKRQFNNAGHSIGSAVDFDPITDSIYIAGHGLGSVDGQPNAGGLDAFVVRYDSNGNLIWTRQLRTSADENIRDLDIDSNGNIHVAGSTKGTLLGNTSAGMQDAFAAKYDSSGKLLWNHQFGTAGEDNAAGVGVDSNGNVFISGAFEEGPGAGSWDAFLTGFDSNGDRFSWTQQFSTPGWDGQGKMTFDANGNFYAAGWAQGAIDGQPYAGSLDPLVMKYALTQTYTENTAIALKDIVILDKDPEDTVTATLTLSDVNAGILTTEAINGTISTFENGVWRVSGAAADVNALLANIKFIPATNYNRDLTIAASVTDNIAPGVNNTINLKGTAVNEAPTLTTISTLTGATQNKPFTITYADLANAANEADVDGDAIAFQIDAVASGTLTKNGQPVVPGTTTLAVGEAIAWIPDTAGDSVPAFSVRATDGTAVSDNAVEVAIAVAISSDSWIRQLGTASVDTASGVTVDSAGNVYIAGYTRSSLDGNTNGSGQGAIWPDPFIAKYDSNGNKLWTSQIGSSGTDYYNDITLDNAGNLYTVGYDDGSGNVGGAVVIAKWDNNGNLVWRQWYDTQAQDSASGITTDSEGNIYIAGMSDYSVRNLGGNADAFVAKYNPQGDRVWVEQLATAGQDQARSVTTDSAGNIYVAGVTEGSLDGNINAGETDVFLTKYDASGNKLWTSQLGSNAADGYGAIGGSGEFSRNVQVATDSAGNIYISGTTEGSLDGNANAGGQDAFVAKYDPTGNKLWTRQLGTAASDRAWGITVDSAGTVQIAGTTEGALDGKTNLGGVDSFVTTYDSDGNKLSTRLLGTTASDRATDIASDRSGNIYTTGYTTGSLGDTNAGNQDAWVSKNSYTNIGPIYTNPANGNRYYLTTADTWTLAQNQAVAAGGNLITINDAAEEAWLKSTFGTSNYFWIGLTDRETEGQFEWVSGQPVTYLNWTPGEPNNVLHTPEGEDFTVIGWGNGWNDAPNMGPDLLPTKGIVEIEANGKTGINYPNFSSIDGLNLLGTAAQVGEKLRLTPKGTTGAAWHVTKQSVEDGFETTFQFQINDLTGGGADGFAFVIQNNSAAALGTGANGMGINGIPNSLALEFDTWDNDQPGSQDPNNNHISVITEGTAAISEFSLPLGLTTAIPNLSDGKVHTVKVKYVSGTLQIFIDDLTTPALTVSVDLATTLNLDNGKAWVGFTGGTGGLYENHDILNWSFSEG